MIAGSIDRCYVDVVIYQRDEYPARIPAVTIVGMMAEGMDRDEVCGTTRN